MNHWIKIENCGNFICTGLYNFPVIDEDGSTLRTFMNKITGPIQIENFGSFEVTNKGGMV